VLFYNTELFKEAGIIAPKAVDDAWTWDEFLDAAKKLTRDTNGDGRTDIWGFAMSRTQLHSMQTWMAQNGQVELVSPDGLNVDGYLNSPKVIEAMEFYQSLTQVHKVTPAEMIPDIFPRGLTAMEQAKSQVIPFYEENYPDFEYDIMPLPKKERQATNCGGFHLGISRQSKDKDLAAEFLIWMAGKEGHKYWIEHGGPLPCRRSTTAALSRFASHPYNLVVDQWERYAVSRPVTPGYAFLHDKVNEVFKDIALGAPVKETLESAVWQINDELSRYQ
jgi:fructooligosaccharide transport system substrate-binding protein